MRRLPAVLAALGLTAVALVGCSASASTAAGCPRPAPPTTAALDLVDVSGAPGATPTVTVRGPLHTDQIQWRDLTTGSGTTVTDPAQLVVLGVTVIGGDNGEPTVSTSYDGDVKNLPTLTQLETVFPELGDALHCATEGSRVAIALPPDAIDQSAGNVGLADGESAVLVVDIRKAYLPAADGALQYNDARGVPTVVRAENGQPGIIIPDGDAPSSIVTQTLKKGDGATVAAGDSVRVHLTVVDWDTRKVTTTTWGKAPQSVDTTSTSLPPGLVDALVGATVGSQILLVAPGTASGSATAAVIDVLGIDAAAH